MIKVKKIELHVHLDGSINRQRASELLGYDATKDLVVHDAHSLAEFLEKFDLSLKLLQTPENLREFSYLLGKDLVADGVIYAEVRFCPLLHTKCGLGADQVIEEILAGFRLVPELKVNLILCMMRNLSSLANARIVNLAREFLGHGVCAVDLAGDEHAHPNYQFEELFAYVRELEVPFTIHASEATDAQGTADAIRFGARRIGHGVRVIEDEHVLRRLIVHRTPIEVCVKSNIDTGVYKTYAEHPVRKLLDAGVAVTINTDDRTVCDTTLEREYDILRKFHHFTKEELLRCNLNSVAASFASSGTKSQLRKELMTDFTT